MIHSHLVLLVLVANVQVLCGADHRLHGGEDVLVHQLGEATFVFLCVPGAMDDTHLLDERTLAALTRA